MATQNTVSKLEEQLGYHNWTMIGPYYGYSHRLHLARRLMRRKLPESIAEQDLRIQADVCPIAPRPRSQQTPCQSG